MKKLNLNNKKIILLIVFVTGFVILINKFLLIDRDDYVVKVSTEKVSIYEYKYFLNNLKFRMEKRMNLTYADESEKNVFWKSSLPGMNESVFSFVKEQAMISIIDYEVQYLKAIEEGIILTIEDEKIIDEKIEATTLKGSSEYDKMNEMFKNTGMSFIQYKEILRKIEIVRKFVEKNQKTIKYQRNDLIEYYEANKEKIDKVLITQIMFKYDKNTSDTDKKEIEKEAMEVYRKIYDRQDSMENMYKKYSNGHTEAIVANKVELRGDNLGWQELVVWAFGNDKGTIGLEKTESAYHVCKIEKKYKEFELLENDVIESYLNAEYMKLIETWKIEERFLAKKNKKVYDGINEF